MSKRSFLGPALILSFLFMLLGAVMSVYGNSKLIPEGQEQKDNAIKAESGELNPYPVDFSKPFNIMLSSGVSFQYSFSSLFEGVDLSTLPIFDIFQLMPNQFKIAFSGTKMLVSADIRNPEGELVAQIVNNTWQTSNPNTMLFWDRNYNAYAFEIVNSNNKPFLQVIMVGPNRIQIGGLFYSENGGSIYINPVEGDAELFINVNSTQHLEDNATLHRIFKYPCLREPENLGKMINPIYLASDPLSDANQKIWMGEVFSIAGIIIATIFGGIFVTLVYDKLKKDF